jgi:Na+/H+-dicarboxylate symporter
MADNSNDPKLIDRIDESKRTSIRKMVVGAAFIVPTVASFSLNGLAINEAHAAVYCANCTIVGGAIGL